MLALIYLGLAIALGELICRRFYRFVSTPHSWAAAILVGILLSTSFTYLAWLAFAHTADALLWADLLFFVVAPGAIFWLSRKAPKVDIIAPRAPGSSKWDWTTLAVLAIAVCVLLMGTLYINNPGKLRISDMQVGDLAPQLATAQNFALGHNFPTQYAGQPNHRDLLFYFQTGNLEFLGLNLAWSIDVLSALGVVSVLALVMALGELLFNSRVVGRLGGVLLFFHGWPPLIQSITSKSLAHEAVRATPHLFISQRHLFFAIGTLLLVLIFLIDQYRQRRLLTNARAALKAARGFIFSVLLLVMSLPWNASVLRPAAVALFCVFAAYGLWWLWKLKTPPVLGPLVAAILTASTVAGGVSDLLPIYNSSRIEVNYEREQLVKGLVFRTSDIYKLPASLTAGVAGKDLSKPPVTAFEGGQGDGKGQFDSPRGIAIDSAGNIFVADTGNRRIQKFSPNGTFVISIAATDPNGIAIDHAGNIYVAEIASKHCVQKLAPDGKFIAELAPGFYGPRRIAIGPDDLIYVLDSGNNRVVKFCPHGQVLASWGSQGSDDGQFKGLSSVAVDPITNKVYVADPMNSRIQVFGSNGQFLTKWLVPEWGQPLGFEDLAIDSQRGRLYASSTHMSIILVFDLQGNRTGTLTPSPPDKLNSPSALALVKDKLFVLDSGSARVSVIDLQNR